MTTLKQNIVLLATTFFAVPVIGGCDEVESQDQWVEFEGTDEVESQETKLVNLPLEDGTSIELVVDINTNIDDLVWSVELPSLEGNGTETCGSRPACTDLFQWCMKVGGTFTAGPVKNAQGEILGYAGKCDYTYPD